MPSMQILSPTEQRAFGTPPMMNAAQRKAAFDLPLGFQKEAEQLRDPVHQIGFCLNAGYFCCASIKMRLSVNQDEIWPCVD